MTNEECLLIILIFDYKNQNHYRKLKLKYNFLKIHFMKIIQMSCS